MPIFPSPAPAIEKLSLGNRVARPTRPIGIQETPQTPAFFPNQLDLSAPSSAALDILGVAASKAKSPTSLQEWALGPVSSFDQNGLLKTGFAYNQTIYKFDHRLSANDLRRDEAYRILEFTNLAFAGVKGTGDDKSSRVALSASIPIVDKTDWRFDAKTFNLWNQQAQTLFIDQVLYEPVTAAIPVKGQLNDWIKKIEARISALAKAKGEDGDIQTIRSALVELKDDYVRILSDTATEPELTGDPKAAWEAAKRAVAPLVDLKKQGQFFLPGLTKLVEDLRDAYNRDHWNAPKLDVSLAYALFAQDGSKDSLKGEGSYATLAYARPLFRTAQLTAFGRYADRDRTWDKDAKTWDRSNLFSFGGRIRGGNQDGGGFVEYLYTQKKPDGKPSSTDQLYQAGYERRVGRDQWLQISLGSGSGSYAHSLFGINFSFNLTPTRILKPDGTPVEKG